MKIEELSPANSHPIPVFKTITSAEPLDEDLKKWNEYINTHNKKADDNAL
jgi:hypothetical protein